MTRPRALRYYHRHRSPCGDTFLLMDTFCKIARHRLPAHIIYENRSLMAFLDIEPVSPGHTLVIPKKHYENFTDLPPALRHSLFDLAARVASALRRMRRFHGVILHHASGRLLQDVPHCHLHVYGKRLGDDKPFYASLDNTSGGRNGALKAVADQLRRIIR